MQLSCGELHNLSELILSCVNSITNMAMFKNQVTDSELKTIIETHFPIHVQDYNMKVKFVKDATAPTEKLNVPELKKILQDFTKSPVPTAPVTSRTDIQKLNDREIATGYLLTLTLNISILFSYIFQYFLLLLHYSYSLPLQFQLQHLE